MPVKVPVKTAPPEPKSPEDRVPLTLLVPSVPVKVTCEELVMNVSVLPDQVPLQAVATVCPALTGTKVTLQLVTCPPAPQGEAERAGVILPRVGFRR